MEISPAEAQLATSVASVVFSGVLVSVTYLYYRETKAHTEEMEESRKAEFKPVLKGTIEPKLGLHNHLYIENTGKGAAHDVEAKWGFEHLDEEVEWAIPLVTPGQRHEFALPFTEDLNSITTHEAIKSELEGSDGTLYFEWHCEDALGNEVAEREEIDVLKTIATRSGSEFVMKDEQREIRKELEDVTSAIEDVSGVISDESNDIQKTNSVKENLQELGTATLEELSMVTGLSDREVALIASNLETAGVVEYDIPEDAYLIHQEASETEIEWIGY